MTADAVLLSQVDLNHTQNSNGFSHCHELGRQAPHFLINGVSWGNLDSKRSIPKKPASCGLQGKSGCHYVIDLEKPATLDEDDVEIVSSPAFTNYANHNGGLSDNSQCVPLESSSVMRAHLCRDQSAPYVTSG